MHKKIYKIISKSLTAAFVCCFANTLDVAQDCIMAQAESAAKIAGSLTAATKICGLATPVELATSKKEVKLSFKKIIHAQKIILILGTIKALMR